jgi:CRP-like cAMP-binding protein
MSNLALFQNATNLKTFSAGAVIFKEGELGNVMYIVKEGSVELRVRGILVETVAQNGVFGELDLIDGKARSATAIAKTDCRLIPVDRERFHWVIEKAPFFAIQIMKIMAARLRRMNSKF